MTRHRPPVRVPARRHVHHRADLLDPGHGQLHAAGDQRQGPADHPGRRAVTAVIFVLVNLVVDIGYALPQPEGAVDVSLDSAARRRAVSARGARARDARRRTHREHAAGSGRGSSRNKVAVAALAFVRVRRLRRDLRAGRSRRTRRTRELPADQHRTVERALARHRRPRPRHPEPAHLRRAGLAAGDVPDRRSSRSSSRSRSA